MLRSRLGDEAVFCLLRLWAHCQETQRGGRWGKVNALYVEAVCEWKGKPGELWEALIDTPLPGKHPWVEVKKDGSVVIHSWDKHNAGLIAAWKNGPLGGRPRKNPPDNHNGTGHEPNGNPPVTGRVTSRVTDKKRPDRNGAEGNYPEVTSTHEGPSLDTVIEWGKMDAVPEEQCRRFHAYYSGLGWMNGRTPIAHPRQWLAGWRQGSPRSAAPRALERKKGESIFEKKTRKENLAEYLKNHPANPQTNFSGEPDPGEKKDYEDRQREYDELVRDLARGGTA